MIVCCVRCGVEVSPANEGSCDYCAQPLCEPCVERNDGLCSGECRSQSLSDNFGGGN